MLGKWKGGGVKDPPPPCQKKDKTANSPSPLVRNHIFLQYNLLNKVYLSGYFVAKKLFSAVQYNALHNLTIKWIQNSAVQCSALQW